MAENITVWESSNKSTCWLLPDVQKDWRNAVWVSERRVGQTNWHTNSPPPFSGSSVCACVRRWGARAGISCHISKCIQLAYLSFQFPFEVNTEQSRWRYDWLNWTRLSKYYMTSHRLSGVIGTHAKCCCRQLCTHSSCTRSQKNECKHTRKRMLANPRLLHTILTLS